MAEDNAYSPESLAHYNVSGLITNGNWYRIEAEFRATAPQIRMTVYDEVGVRLGTISANDTTYSSTTLYLGGYGNGEEVFDEFTERSSAPITKGVYFKDSTNGYKYRKKITVSPDKVTGRSYDFIYLVSMTDSDLKTVSNGGLVQQNPLLDIRFETTDGVKLAHEIENYTPTTGDLIAWVKLPLIDPGTEFYMYFGNDISGQTTEYNWIPSVTTSGITLGVRSTNLTANRNSNSATGGYNLGELYSYCTSIIDIDGNSLTLNDSAGENSAQESGSFYYGYLLYHTSATGSRFTMASGGKRANFALVTYDGTNWKYDNNSTLVNFTPNSSDVLVARIKWGSATGFECLQPIYAGEEDVMSLWYWSQFRGVYHMNAIPDANASTFEHNDSGWYSQSGSSNGSMNSADRVSGKINYGLDFDGSNDWVNLLDATGSVLRVTGDLTLSIWVYPRTGGTRRNIVGKTYGGEYELTQEVDNTLSFYWGRSGANSGTSGATNGYQGISIPGAMALNQWHHIVVSRKLGTGGWIRVFVDGVLKTTATPLYTSAVASAINTTLGNGRLSTAFFNGIMDELRFSQVARDDSWIITEYNNQNSPST